MASKFSAPFPPSHVLAAAVVIARARILSGEQRSAEAFLAPLQSAPRFSPATTLRAGRSPAPSVDRATPGRQSAPPRCASALALAGLAAGAAARGRRSGRNSRASQRAGAAAATPACSAEVAELERAAAQLRADAANLEREVEERRLEEQAKWFRIFDLDGSGAVDLVELQTGMRELCGQKVDESMASRLLEAHDENKDGLLQRWEFDTGSLERTLEKFKAEDYDKELAAWKEERRLAEEARAEAEVQRMRKEYEASLPVANEDTGAFTRIGSVLVYLLPLLNALKLGIPLAAASPAFQAFITPLFGLAKLMGSVPFGQLLIFITLQTLADNRELPLLLRFNMRQAVVLDIALGMLQLLQVLAAYALLGEAPADLFTQWDSNGVVFLGLLGCITYSAVLSLIGYVPNNIPWISAYAERHLAPTRRVQGTLREASSIHEYEDTSPSA